jgi:hypothetical protein
MVKSAVDFEALLPFSDVLLLFQCAPNIQYEKKHTSDSAGCLINYDHSGNSMQLYTTP